MKNFDIENFERKDIFKTPESFLEEMKAQVLQEISSVKGFDIENLERKNVFDKPEGFFENMQAKVLQEVQPVVAKKEGRIVRMNWVYAAAAAITMFFGVTFFVNQNKTDENIYVADSEIAITGNDVVTNSFTQVAPTKESTAALEILEKDLTSGATQNQKVNTKTMAVVANTKANFTEKKSAPKQNTEVQVEQMLSNFTSAEVAQLGKNVEQDIYLDLYN